MKSLLLVVAALALVVSSSPARAETLTDRCSGTVRIPPHFNDGAGAPGTVELKRDSKGFHKATAPFTVEIEKSNPCNGSIFSPSQYGKFRWYCQSKGSSSWTEEQSRCRDFSTRLSASLGPNRLVQFQCLGGGVTPNCPQSGGSGNNVPGTGQLGGACAAHDQCGKGSTCNLSTHKCDKVSGTGCGGLGLACCPGNSANPIGCSNSQCVVSTCQPCGGLNEACCGGGNLAPSCGGVLVCSGGFCANKIH